MEHNHFLHLMYKVRAKEASNLDTPMGTTKEPQQKLAPSSQRSMKTSWWKKGLLWEEDTLNGEDFLETEENQKAPGACPLLPLALLRKPGWRPELSALVDLA
ncbi:uncharacterized protein LOC102419534 isoform X2 [Myotis lucifugus]|uniref:uncharacterized protein LOC102419534 isoform X2 n=1 Tax=Myotis lucifugus TaxID=59463 RepID=UPI000CCC040F|nr:uncharacterized protein LOC102419534 isoform X2 [Myotis lucifugus]